MLGNFQNKIRSISRRTDASARGASDFGRHAPRGVARRRAARRGRAQVGGHPEGHRHHVRPGVCEALAEG